MENGYAVKLYSHLFHIAFCGRQVLSVRTGRIIMIFNIKRITVK